MHFPSPGQHLTWYLIVDQTCKIDGKEQPKYELNSNWVPEDGFAFGPSSNIHFIQRVAEASDRSRAQTHIPTPCHNQPLHLGQEVTGFSSAEHTVTVCDWNAVQLPQRHVADRLIQGYWNTLHAVFPVLHQPSFTGAYNELWEPVLAFSQSGRGQQDHMLFVATVNVVLALGCEFSDKSDIAQKKKQADKLYRQSQRLVSIETLDFSSLQVVQLLLLRGVYLQYTSHANQCWNMVGVAVRVAQGLGLHMERDGSSLSTAIMMREMRRRVWYCCVFLDRYVDLSCCSTCVPSS